MANGPSPAPPPIIIIRKKGGHGGHHGGAWKVAYADFVTAMMALFIVLWLLSSSEQVKKAVGGYFQDPTGKGNLTGTTMAGVGDGMQVTKQDMSQLKQKIQEAMKQLPKFEQMKDHVEMTLTTEGLRIEMLETDKGMFFESGSAKPTDESQAMLAMLATQLRELPNKLMVEGHTDAKPYASQNGYSNWELSADRANSARRVLQTDGVSPTQIAQIRGFADQRLRMPKEPENPANRRISVIVQYLPDQIPKPDALKAATAEPYGASGGHGEKPAEGGHGEPPAAKGGH